MAGVDELFDAPTPMGSDLLAGLKQIALDQKVPFKLYGRVVLPADGYVFWVLGKLLPQKPFQPPNLLTAYRLSKDEMERSELNVQCSLHFTTDFRQEEAENYAANRMVMTSKTEIQELRAIRPGTMYIGEFEGIKFGFSSQTMRFWQSGLWHYTGFAVFPDMLPQIVDSVVGWSPDLIVSNSLPAWLSLPLYNPPWKIWQPLPPVFPSFLVPDNEPPPYVTVHIPPESTTAMSAMPQLDSRTQSQTQLASDIARITMWGLNNAQAMDFMAAVFDYCSNSGSGGIGLMNTPIPRDEKRTQAETRTISKKKTAEFQVSYLQGSMRNIARQTIKTCIPTISVDGEQISPEPDEEDAG